MTDFEKFMNDEVTPDMPGDAFYSLEMTDAYKVGYWRDLGKTWVEQNQDKILSIRVFNEMREVRLSRFDIGSDFVLRDKDDEKNPPEEVNGHKMIIEEWQILDVDTTWFEDEKYIAGTYKTTGGGIYDFPLPGPGKDQHPAVLIRHYLASKTGPGESGQTYVSDWRCVGFANRSKEEWS